MTRRSLLWTPTLLAAQAPKKAAPKAPPWEFAVSFGGSQKMTLRQFRGKVVAVEILKTT